MKAVYFYKLLRLVYLQCLLKYFYRLYEKKQVLLLTIPVCIYKKGKHSYIFINFSLPIALPELSLISAT